MSDRRHHGATRALVLAELQARPWQTAKQLDPLVGYPSGTILMQLAESGVVERRPGAGRRAPYEYAVMGAKR